MVDQRLVACEYALLGLNPHQLSRQHGRRDLFSFVVNLANWVDTAHALAHIAEFTRWIGNPRQNQGICLPLGQSLVPAPHPRQTPTDNPNHLHRPCVCQSMFVEVLSSRQPFARFAGAPPKLSPRVPSDLGLTGSASTPWNKAATACKKSPKSAKLKRSGSRFWFVCLPCCFLCRWTSHRAFDVGKEAQIPGHQSWSFGPHSQDPSWRSWAAKGLFQCCWTLCHLLRPRFQTKPTSVCDPGNNWACLERFAQRLLCCFPATKPQFAFVYGAVGSGQVLAARSYKQAINRRNWALLSM